MNYLEEKSKHYRRIREDSLYRMSLMLEYLEDSQLPPMGYYPEEPKEESQLIQAPLYQINAFEQLKGKVVFLENKVMELRVDKKGKRQFVKYS